MSDSLTDALELIATGQVGRGQAAGSTNRFHRAHRARGSASEAMVIGLDNLLTVHRSEKFNEWRTAVGIPAHTPNRRLSRQEAWLLRRHIETTLEAKGNDHP